MKLNNMKIKSKIIKTNKSNIKLLVLDSRKTNKLVNGILWIHGGGYVRGVKEHVLISRAMDILKKYETVVISPGYTLATKEPYPKALNDCYEALEYIYDNAQTLGIDKEKIIVGGESAGGGLALSTTLLARDKEKIKVKAIFPLYPMIDYKDTKSSINNHSYIWNTKKNHKAWKKYLGKKYYEKEIEEYASPSNLKDFNNLPPIYTFVSDKEPFYEETINFIKKAQENNIDAKVDIYSLNIHEFDILCPFLKQSKIARKKFIENYNRIINKYLKE